MASEPSGINKQRALQPLIKTLLLDSGRIDPRHLTHGEVLAARLEHEEFLAIEDPEQFFSLVKRVASQYILAIDLGANLTFDFGFGLPSHSTRTPNLTRAQDPGNSSASTKPSAKTSAKPANPLPAKPNTSKNISPKQSKSKQSNMANVHISCPKELSLPTVISEWKDKNNQNRIHVFIQAPSGTSFPPPPRSGSITNVKLDDDRHLLFSFKWPMDVINAERLFSHTRFGGRLGQDHGKLRALSVDIDEVTQGGGQIVSTIKVSLPIDKNERYMFTESEVSGHAKCVPIMLEKPKQVCPTIILLFDFVKKHPGKGPTFSKLSQARVEDDLELG